MEWPINKDSSLELSLFMEAYPNVLAMTCSIHKCTVLWRARFTHPGCDRDENRRPLFSPGALSGISAGDLRAHLLARRCRQINGHVIHRRMTGARHVTPTVPVHEAKAAPATLAPDGRGRAVWARTSYTGYISSFSTLFLRTVRQNALNVTGSSEHRLPITWVDKSIPELGI